LVSWVFAATCFACTATPVTHEHENEGLDHTKKQTFSQHCVPSDCGPTPPVVPFVCGATGTSKAECWTDPDDRCVWSVVCQGPKGAVPSRK
jgi:hypothetical protein